MDLLSTVKDLFVLPDVESLQTAGTKFRYKSSDESSGKSPRLGEKTGK